MPFESNIDFKTVLGDTDPAATVPRGFASGYVPRDFKTDPVGLRVAGFRGRKYPQGDWDELADLQEKNKTSPYHTHKNRVGIMSQGMLPYCWCYGPVAGVATQYAKTGIEPVPDLNAAAPAFQITGFRLRGSWASEAVEAIQRYGIPTFKTWPKHSRDRTLPADPRVKKDSFRHNLIEFRDLGEQPYELMMSCLLDPVDPAPCTFGSASWGHLVLALQAVKVKGQWGVLFANSWGTNWGRDGGYGIRLGGRARPDESIRIGKIKPRSEK